MESIWWASAASREMVRCSPAWMRGKASRTYWRSLEVITGPSHKVISGVTTPPFSTSSFIFSLAREELLLFIAQSFLQGHK